MRTPAEAHAALRALPCGAHLVATLGGAEGVWLVGGAVRDLLLGRDPRELDLAVEGEVERVAARLAGADGTVVAHGRFETATVTVGGCAFDLARTRTERYATAGALPDVAPAPLDQDLRRRDFTVNAIALGLGPDAQVDPVPGALEDLDAGLLRVLHPESFTEDPTRVWRLARYCARLGFGVEPVTASLAARADPATVSGPRHGNELRLVLREPDPQRALAQLAELNPGYLPERFDHDPAGLGGALALLPADGRRDLLTLAACVKAMDLRALLAWLDHLGFRGQERDTVAAASREATWGPLHAARTPSQIARAARGAPLEAVALAGGDNARRWLAELRHVTLEISGTDVLAAGVPQGPELGRALQRALDAKLDGHAAGREAELRAARSRP